MGPTQKYRYDQRTQETLEHLTVPFAVYQFVDRRVVTLVLSDGFCQLFGYEDRAQAYYDMDHNMYKDAHPDDAARIANAALRFATEGGSYEVIYRTRTSGSDDYRIVHAYGRHVYSDEGVRLAHVWYSDEGVYAEGHGGPGMGLTQSLSDALHDNSMVRASQYDSLTGLPNMTYFFELAEAFTAEVRAVGKKPALLYMDFVGMKFYNSAYGFAEGDKLLRSFARLLADVFGNERSCRIGADHFAALAEEASVDARLQRLLSECQGINDGRGLPVHIGVYVARPDAVHVSMACDRARLACGALRGRYETAVNYYRETLSEETIRRQYVVENLDRAMEEKWIQVYLQPIIRAVNGQVCDVEALARWIDPQRGMLPPASFIPALEDARLIHKLDLYMVEQVLASIKEQMAEGFFVIPHSVNLSRLDFDACDMVEEIRRRVDEAGVARDRITIEITESVIGGDLEFMKTQVERFQELGFPVWMDDFGSGYSSLDILQSIRFDLLKFDRSFMQGFDEGENGKILLSELMRMATSLGVDTVCEGVETEEQVHFLLEIGCSKLQGFFYSKPIPFESIREMRNGHTLIKNENPDESDYYESIGRASLYGIGTAADNEGNALHHVFSSLPMAILEVRGSKARYVRSNHSYQDFIARYFGIDLLRKSTEFTGGALGYGATFGPMVKKCCATGRSAFFDEKAPDGSVVHLFVRRVSSNPVTGSVAVSVAILSIAEPNDNATYAEIASALAADYYDIYIIDLDSNEYIEYASEVGNENMSLRRYGGDFFESARHETMERIYEEDREPFLALFTKENVLADLDEQGVFTTTYRLVDTGTPVYVNMKITRMQGKSRLILGISNVDQHMKQLEEARRLREERTSLGRIAALSPNYLVLYTVDPSTDRYTQYNPSVEFGKFGLATQGEDFFGDVVRDAPRAIDPEDMERHLRVLTKENVLAQIRRSGSFTHRYRLLLDGKRVPATLRAVMVEEDKRQMIILGVTRDDE